jgi:hypothetical protein
MTASEPFNDNELAAFFTLESEKQLTAQRIEQEHAFVQQRLWNAVEQLEMDLAVGSNPEQHDDDFEALVNTIDTLIDTLPPNTDPDYSRKEHVRAIANGIWDEQVAMLEQISMALDMQLHGTISPADKAQMKKKIMARIIIRDDNTEDWLQLADAVLEGEALDSNNPDDFEYVTEALEVAANLDSSPEMKLYDSVLKSLGVPDLSQDIPDDYDMNLLELLTYVARDITEAAITHGHRAQQPDRHSSIHEVLQTYGLIEEVDTEAVLKLSDDYAELKAAH